MLKEVDTQTNRLVYALADTSYGECCIDDVTASHAKANDAIVHFGHSCFSTEAQESDTKQIVYVLPTAPSDETEWLEQVRSSIQE
mmetsp:Transcript_24176/g.29983  ORF Transcript_24176/g.29983 Transcript_24176/m.29983 type:complete len:85 (-) Transcript_24176:112-366(-)